MALSPPAPIPVSLERSDDLPAILTQLQCRPDHRRFGDLYDLTSPVVYAWALSATRDRAGAESATLAAYAWLWRRSRSYPGSSLEPWTWVRTAMAHALLDQRHADQPAI